MGAGLPAMARLGRTCCTTALLSRASPLPQGVGLGRGLSGRTIIGGSGLARDVQNWTYLLHRGALMRASPLPQGVGLGRALSGRPLIGGSGLACDGQTWGHLLLRGALIASKPAPTGDWAWQRIEWAPLNRWERACPRCRGFGQVWLTHRTHPIQRRERGVLGGQQEVAHVRGIQHIGADCGV